MDSERIAKQFGQSDVYASTKIIMNIYRIHGSRSKGKDNPREGKGARWGGKQREANCPDAGDQTGGDDNCQHQESFESRGVISIKIYGGVRPWMFAIRGEALSQQAIWIGGGDYGTDSELGRYLGNHDGSCEYEDMNNQADIEVLKVFANDIIIRRKQGEEQRPFKQLRGAMRCGE